ncbi:uncharacterized protein LOC111137540 [Crassostrea virginica]
MALLPLYQIIFHLKQMNMPMAAEVRFLLLWLISFYFFDTVSGWLTGEACGSGNCLYGYHCCSDSTGYCCPDGYICSGTICISLTVIIAPVVIGVVVIIVIIVIVIACKKKRAQGVIIAPNTNVGYNVQQQTTHQYGQQPGQPGSYPYGQPAHPGQMAYPPNPPPQGPPPYMGNPQYSTDPAYPPPPADYKTS